MSTFRRVRGACAGANALGILVPPGRRTMMIVRPRALDWDLLPITAAAEQGRPGSFHELTRDEAARQAQVLYRALEAWRTGEPGRVVPVAIADGGYQVQAEVGGLTLVACARVPGRPYRPMVFATLEAARTAAERIAGIFRPPPGVCQEIYVNTQNFLS